MGQIRIPPGGDAGAYREQRAGLALAADHRCHKRAAIAKIYCSIGTEYLAHAAATPSDPQTRRVYSSALSLTETVAEVLVHISCLLCRFDESDRSVAASAWASIIPADWSFLLALRVPRFGIDLDDDTPGGDNYLLKRLGRTLMQTYTVRFHVDAPPSKVWQLLHPPAPPDSPKPRVLEWPTGRMEILKEGDEAGEGLVRTCVFAVPKYLLSGGKGRSLETVTEAKINKLSRYVSVGKPLWSRADGYHELEEQTDGTTVLTFQETYHAFNPVLRFLLERPVHAKLCRDVAKTYEQALSFVGKVRRLT